MVFGWSLGGIGKGEDMVIWVRELIMTSMKVERLNAPVMSYWSPLSLNTISVSLSCEG